MAEASAVTFSFRRSLLQRPKHRRPLAIAGAHVNDFIFAFASKCATGGASSRWRLPLLYDCRRPTRQTRYQGGNGLHHRGHARRPLIVVAHGAQTTTATTTDADLEVQMTEIRAVTAPQLQINDHLRDEMGLCPGMLIMREPGRGSASLRSGSRRRMRSLR